MHERQPGKDGGTVKNLILTAWMWTGIIDSQTCWINDRGGGTPQCV